MENTDRELLEMAAKAVGIEATWVRNSGAFYYDNPETGHEIFDPLTDDGDALRLAIALKLDILWAEHENSVVACNDSSDDEPVCEKVRFISEAGPATRRAIVRAAAEIGKGMK